MREHGGSDDVKRLWPEKDDALWDAWLRERSDVHRNALVMANRGLAYMMAKRARAVPNWLRDELEGLALETLIYAVEGFDVTRGVCFSTYAAQAVRMEIYSAIRTWRSRLLKMGPIRYDIEERRAKSIEKMAMLAEEVARCEAFLGEIPNTYRHVVESHFLRGEKLNAIAKRLKVSKTTAGNYLNRGLMMLRLRARRAA